jgi:membrane-bound lytic murein transglycosylase B
LQWGFTKLPRLDFLMHLRPIQWNYLTDEKDRGSKMDLKRSHTNCHLFSLALASILPMLLIISPTYAYADWTPLIERLVADKFDEQVIRKIFDQPGVNFDPDIMSCKLKELINKRYKKQDAGSARKIKVAYARFLRPEVIAEAQSYLQRNRETLQGIAENYCVPKEIVVSILLVETELGQHLGNRGAFNTLASMALSYDLETIRPYLAPDLLTRRNEDFAKKRCRQKADWAYGELKALIRYASENGIDPLSIPGSLYGAIGICQFMPTKISVYGVDADRDGRINLFSEQDALYSMANYLRSHGWRCNMSMKRQYRVILAYNHSNIYADTVMNVAKKLKERD